MGVVRRRPVPSSSPTVGDDRSPGSNGDSSSNACGEYRPSSGSGAGRNHRDKEVTAAVAAATSSSPSTSELSEHDERERERGHDASSAGGGTASREEGSIARREGKAVLLLHRLAAAFAAALLLLSLSLLVRALLLHSDLHHGGECDMTWSHLKFLPLEVSSPATMEEETSASPAPPANLRRYRLLKFVDLRDPRHRHLYDSRTEWNGDDGKRTLTSEDNWCLQPGGGDDDGGGKGRKEAPYPNPGHPVLYVPGHWGEYKQARSVGAHGLGWTRRAVSRQEVEKKSEALATGSGGDDFLFDVYAVDFNGEGGALHGSRLVRQAAFVAEAVRTIADACGGSTSVTIVAHSVGGIVARAVPLLHPLTTDFIIKDIITLASPHSYMPWGFDGTVREFWRFVNNVDRGKNDVSDNIMVVSISGGIRDELIPPDACEIEVEDGISVLSSDIMFPRSAPSDSEYARYTLAESTGLGMDHKASCWCHNLLMVVRDVIRTLVVTTTEGRTRARENEAKAGSQEEDGLGGEGSGGGGRKQERRKRRDAAEDMLRGMGAKNIYSDALAEQERLLEETYGFWTALALRTAAPYRLGTLVVLYAITTCLYPAVVLLAAFRSSGTVMSLSTSSSKGGGGGGGGVSMPSPTLAFVRCEVYAILPFLSILVRRGLLFAGVLGRTPGHCSDTAVETVLAAWASAVHALLMHLLLPAASWVALRWTLRRNRRSCNTKVVKEKGQNETRPFPGKEWHCGRSTELRPMLAAFVLTGAVMSAIHVLFTKEAMALNRILVLAVCFVSAAVQSLTAAASIGCRDDDFVTSSGHGLDNGRMLLLRRSVSALLLIVLPFLLAGKVVFAFSQMTTAGQEDRALLGAFLMKARWSVGDDKRVGYDGGVFNFMAVLWHDDLFITTVLLWAMVEGLRKCKRICHR